MAQQGIQGITGFVLSQQLTNLVAKTGGNSESSASDALNFARGIERDVPALIPVQRQASGLSVSTQQPADFSQSPRETAEPQVKKDFLPRPEARRNDKPAIKESVREENHSSRRADSGHRDEPRAERIGAHKRDTSDSADETVESADDTLSYDNGLSQASDVVPAEKPQTIIATIQEVHQVTVRVLTQITAVFGRDVAGVDSAAGGLAAQLQASLEALRALLSNLNNGVFGALSGQNGQAYAVLASVKISSSITLFSQDAGAQTPAAFFAAIQDQLRAFQEGIFGATSGQLGQSQAENLFANLGLSVNAKAGDLSSLADGLEALQAKLAAFSQTLNNSTETLRAATSNNALPASALLAADAAQAELAGNAADRVLGIHAQVADHRAGASAPTANGLAVAAAATATASGAQTHSQGGSGQDAGQSPLQLVSLNTGARAGAGTSDSSFAQLVSRVPSAHVLDQVSIKVKTAIISGNSKIHIRLDPADLGKLEIRLDVKADGKTQVIVTADNRQTLELLQQNSASLQRALADAGLKTDSGDLNFNLHGEQQDQTSPEKASASKSYAQALPQEEEEQSVIITHDLAVREGLDITV